MVYHPVAINSADSSAFGDRDYKRMVYGAVGFALKLLLKLKQVALQLKVELRYIGLKALALRAFRAASKRLSNDVICL